MLLYIIIWFRENRCYSGFTFINRRPGSPLLWRGKARPAGGGRNWPGLLFRAWGDLLISDLKQIISRPFVTLLTWLTQDAKIPEKPEPDFGENLFIFFLASLRETAFIAFTGTLCFLLRAAYLFFKRYSCFYDEHHPRRPMRQEIKPVEGLYKHALCQHLELLHYMWRREGSQSPRQADHNNENPIQTIYPCKKLLH